MNKAGYQLKLDPILSDDWGPLHFVVYTLRMRLLNGARMNAIALKNKRYTIEPTLGESCKSAAFISRLLTSNNKIIPLKYQKQSGNIEINRI